MFKEVRQSTITQKIIFQIRTAILEGKLKPGDKLPPEKKLVEMFQVSKQTLREALRALEHMGLIEVKKGVGGGSFIVEVDIEVTKGSLANFLYFKNLTIDNLSEFRKLIEPHAAKTAAEVITSKDLEHLRELNQAARKAIEKHDVLAARDAEIEFHQVIAEQTGNPLLILILDFAENLLVDFKRLLGPDERFFEQVLEAHERIYQAISDRNAQVAADEMFDHIVEVEDGLLKLKSYDVISKVYS